MGLHGPITEAQRAALDKVAQNQARLLALITDILDYAKLESGQLRLEPQVVRARDMLDCVEAAILPQAQTKGITYDCCADCDDIALVADPGRAQQIVLNL